MKKRANCFTFRKLAVLNLWYLIFYSYVDWHEWCWDYYVTKHLFIESLSKPALIWHKHRFQCTILLNKRKKWIHRISVRRENTDGNCWRKKYEKNNPFLRNIRIKLNNIKLPRSPFSVILSQYIWFLYIETMVFYRMIKINCRNNNCARRNVANMALFYKKTASIVWKSLNWNIIIIII